MKDKHIRSIKVILFEEIEENQKEEADAFRFVPESRVLQCLHEARTIE